MPHAQAASTSITPRATSADKESNAPNEIGEHRSEDVNQIATTRSTRQSVRTVSPHPSGPRSGNNQSNTPATVTPDGSSSDTTNFDFVSKMDNRSERQKRCNDIASRTKPSRKRIVGSAPVTKAQVKDTVTTEAREILMKRFFLYDKMVSPGEKDKSGKSTAAWPKLSTALVIVDGFRPRTITGGRWKDGQERRQKKLLTLVAGSKDKLEHVLTS